MSTRTTLRGGSRDGELHPLHIIGGKPQPLLYLPRRISLEEELELRINGKVKWKHPEDIYEYRDEEYHFTRTVSYKP